MRLAMPRSSVANFPRPLALALEWPKNIQPAGKSRKILQAGVFRTLQKFYAIAIVDFSCFWRDLCRSDGGELTPMGATMKTKSRWLVAAFLIVSPLAANADLITIEFTVGGFTDRDGIGGAPTDPVSGTILYEAADLLSVIDSLVSIDLVINGFSYQLDDVGIQSPSVFDPAVDIIGGVLIDPRFVGGQTNDFSLSFDRITGSPGIFLYATTEAFTIWRSREFSEFSRTIATAKVSEPGTLALLVMGLAGLGAARRAKAA
jgi:PEP-CTERM motif